MFWEVPGCRLSTREEAIERVYAFHASQYFRSIRPLPGAAAALTQLSRTHELHVVTSRQDDIADLTRACAAAHFPGLFAALHFGNHFGKSGAKRSKADMCREIGAVALIDDSPSHVAACAAAGVQSFLFGEYGWNVSAGPCSLVLTGRVSRVPNWRALLRALAPAADLSDVPEADLGGLGLGLEG